MVTKIDIKNPEHLHTKINQIIDWCEELERKLNTVSVSSGGITEAYLLDKLDGYIYKRDGYKEDSAQYGCYDLLVREFSQLMKMYKAACASGAEAKTVSVDKNDQKQNLIDLMKTDEEHGMYDK